MNILTVDPVEIQEKQNIIDLASIYSRVIVQKDITAVISVTKWIFTGKSTGTKKQKKTVIILNRQNKNTNLPDIWQVATRKGFPNLPYHIS